MTAVWRIKIELCQLFSAVCLAYTAALTIMENYLEQKTKVCVCVTVFVCRLVNKQSNI